MPNDSHAQFDHTVLEMIEHSPIGAVPHTPAYVDSLTRLYATHQAYVSADHKGGHVTARSLIALPSFHASNLTEFMAGAIDADALESYNSIYDRYVQSLPASCRARAESHRLTVAGKPAHHRAKHGTVVHDPMHTLFLVPGAGPHPGLSGNYLHGSVFHLGAHDSAGSWAVHVHDSDDGAAVFETATLNEALEKLQELLASAPFHLSELNTLGFHMV